MMGAVYLLYNGVEIADGNIRWSVEYKTKLDGTVYVGKDVLGVGRSGGILFKAGMKVPHHLPSRIPVG